MTWEVAFAKSISLVSLRNFGDSRLMKWNTLLSDDIMIR